MRGRAPRRPGRPRHVGRASRATCSSRASPPTASSTCASRATPASWRIGRRHGGRRAHRPAAYGLVRVQRRPAQRAARGRRLELPRQRLRHPHRLPDPRARRLDRRLAALRADRDLPVRRGRLLRQVAPRPRCRAVGQRHRRQHGADAAGRDGRDARARQRLGGLGRRRRCWCRGRSTRSTATSRILEEQLADHGALARLRGADGACRSGTRRGSSRGPTRRRTSSTSGTRASTGASGSCPDEDLSDFGAFIAADKSDVATAFFARSTEVAAQDRTAAGPRRRGQALRGAQRGRRGCLARRVRRTVGRRVTSADAGQPGPGAPLRPGAADAASAGRGPTGRDLVRENGTHLATGFLATPDLLPVLADGGHLDLAVRAALPGPARRRG